MAILKVENLKKYFPVTGGVFLRRTGWVYALDGVSFEINKGETLGIVGESGCGKTTLGRCVMGLYKPSDGHIVVKGKPVYQLGARQRKTLALDLQMIFQDPFESLNPRQTVKEILEEKYVIHERTNVRNRSKGRHPKTDLEKEINRLIQTVGLSTDALGKYPHEFSGGQRQRIGIARAISLEPDIIVCDEPVSALDVSVQSKILNLLLELQKTMGLTYIFISHDLSVVKHVSDRIAVMYLGKIVEMGAAKDVYACPRHPYTHALLSSIPVPDPGKRQKRMVLQGEVPSAEHPPKGCRFNTRCVHVEAICLEKEPELLPSSVSLQHVCACHVNPFDTSAA